MLELARAQEFQRVWLLLCRQTENPRSPVLLRAKCRANPRWTGLRPSVPQHVLCESRSSGAGDRKREHGPGQCRPTSPTREGNCYALHTRSPPQREQSTHPENEDRYHPTVLDVPARDLEPEVSGQSQSEDRHTHRRPRMTREPLGDRAVYLGDGVWWQLTERQHASRQFDRMPQRIRPANPWKGRA